jgi:uncharacterized membrane protein YcfT
MAMVMVVAYHSTLYLQSAGVDAALGRAKAAFELFPMPAFFLIAGMFAARQAHYGFSGLWRRRLLTLLYLYALWSAIRTAFYFIVPGLNGEFGEISATDPRALPLILFWPSSSYWFLYALFLFTLGRWLIARLPVWMQLGASGVVSTLFTSGLVDIGNIGWNRVGGLFFFFVLGAVFSQPIRIQVSRARMVHVAIAAAVFVAVVALILLGMRRVPLVVLTGQVVAVALGILICARLARFRVFGIFHTVGTASLKVYLLHLYIVVPSVALIGLLDPNWPRWLDLATQLALIVATVAGSLALGRLTSRVRWLYMPPDFLRRTRPKSAREARALPFHGVRGSGRNAEEERREGPGAVSPTSAPPS